MVAPFTVPFNIPKGTAVADSYRIAPDFNTLATTGVDANGLMLSGSSFKNYGPGMLISPIASWNFTPYPTTADNIVAATGVAANRWLTLAGDNEATTLTPASNTNIFPPGAPNQFYLQLDWPRVPTISVIGANLAGLVSVTFFGFDWYDRPLQHTYVVQNIGTYPGSIDNDVGGVNTKGKAFYTITGVRFNGATTVGGTISCQVSNTFGLPYVLDSYSDVMRFSYNNNDMLTQGGSELLVAGTVTVQTPAARAITIARTPPTVGGSAPQLSLAHLDGLPAGADVGELLVGAVVNSTPQGVGTFVIDSVVTDASHISWSIPNGAKFITAAADRTAPTHLTGDVRGLFELPYIGETWATPPDGAIKCIFSWYCQGFDQWRNILNAGGQPEGPPPRIVPPNTIIDMYGLPQYYTGIAAT